MIQELRQAVQRYGGKCLPKDVSAIIATASESGYVPRLLPEMQRINEFFRTRSNKTKENRHASEETPQETDFHEQPYATAGGESRGRRGSLGPELGLRQWRLAPFARTDRFPSPPSLDQATVTHTL